MPIEPHEIHRQMACCSLKPPFLLIFYQEVWKDPQLLIGKSAINGPFYPDGWYGLPGVGENPSTDQNR